MNQPLPTGRTRTASIEKEKDGRGFLSPNHQAALGDPMPQSRLSHNVLSRFESLSSKAKHNRARGDLLFFSAAEKHVKGREKKRVKYWTTTIKGPCNRGGKTSRDELT